MVSPLLPRVPMTIRRDRRLARGVLLGLLLTALAVPDGGRATPVALHARTAKVRKIRKVLRARGLAKLPSVSGALAAAVRKHRAGMMADFTGTPPTLVAIPTLDVKSVFWRPGVIDAIASGTATPGQCSEFWSGTADGESGGMGACHMAETVGYSLGDILNSDNSLCYMKRFPTRTNLDNGALTLIAGSFPQGDPTKLFGVPPGSTSRVVAVHVNGDAKSQTVFLRVHSEDENTAAGDLYATDLWYCRGNPTADGFDRIRITTGGVITAEEQQAEDDGSHVATVTGAVTFTDGAVVYDTTQTRVAEVAGVQSGGGFKAAHEIRPDNTFASRSFDTFGGGTSRSYVVASFSGGSVDALRFLAGAFKERHDDPQHGAQPDFAGSTEYRSTYYAASPGSALEARLADVDFDTDPFYADPPSVRVDASAYSCETTPDVEVAIDFANPAGAAIRQQCEAHVYEGSEYCHDDPAVHAAEAGYPTACSGPR